MPKENATSRTKKTLCIFAIALSFAMYAAAFEPFGAAEFAFVFAVPALWVARALGLCTPLRILPNIIGSEQTSRENERILRERKSNRRTYLFACFVFSYAAWVINLIWLRHVYPPAGWAAVILLPLVISSMFIFPWFALAPFYMPKVSDKIGVRLLKLAALASIWVVLEWIRSWIFTGFPWSLLAHSQWLRTPIIQTASIGGVWLVSFTIIFFNLAVEEYFFRLYSWHKAKFANSNVAKQAPVTKFATEFYIALILVFSGVWIYISEIPSRNNERDKFRVGMVQPDFAGILKWQDNLAYENLRVVSRLVKGLKSVGADVAILPEASTPPKWPIIGTPQLREMFERLSADIGAPIALGNMAWLSGEDIFQNGVFVVDKKTGLQKSYYAKHKLVPFGEYVPAWASWLGKVVPVGNMKRGDYFEPLEISIGNKTYRMGNLICYEDVFPDISLQAARQNVDFLFVCTNDSWYGREGGAWQHAAHSALQAAALRKPILRASNNGLSCVFDQYGKMRPTTVLKNADLSVWNADSPLPAKTFEIVDARGRQIDADTLKPKKSSPMLNEKGSIYFRGAGFADAVFYKNFDNKPSFYTRYGNWFVWVCVILGLFGTIPVLYTSKKIRKIDGKM